jgi:general secretion pathway protein D
MVGLPIAEAAKIVIGDMMGANFIVDPKFDAAVTIHTAHPVNKSTALSLFQSALRASGAAMVESKGVYKILPLDQAAAGGDIAVDGRGAGSGRHRQRRRDRQTALRLCLGNEARP